MASTPAALGMPDAVTAGKALPALHPVGGGSSRALIVNPDAARVRIRGAMAPRKRAKPAGESLQETLNTTLTARCFQPPQLTLRQRPIDHREHVDLLGFSPCRPASPRGWWSRAVDHRGAGVPSTSRFEGSAGNPHALFVFGVRAITRHHRSQCRAVAVFVATLASGLSPQRMYREVTVASRLSRLTWSYQRRCDRWL